MSNEVPFVSCSSLVHHILNEEKISSDFYVLLSGFDNQFYLDMNLKNV